MMQVRAPDTVERPARVRRGALHAFDLTVRFLECLLSRESSIATASNARRRRGVGG